ncbi:Succinate dehydrogenase/Fumarate reductase transmembrane subunit [Corynebacterium kalinowskii]|uniref:Succinate dehydrogenase/Fumarate reductase transmembrane subunit n=1 Tax=Corynebacterium kalinowskii TaxID=2675216 RepID=A0A6B8W060_9CORY|nr:succinate dehydrogenase cytochrome b subunit [Corynebacterium kalinowskii]QGU02980.1 Succinate dehydrogenase/Fumarate reductase transmembrane subunit [Corynebacterium kalinowskii]
MTVKFDDRDAVAHGKITEKPLRERPTFPSWALKLTMAVTGVIFGLFVLVHMIGNLKIYLPDVDGKKDLDVYAAFLRELLVPLLPHGWFLWIFRIVLLICLVLHVYGAFALVGRAHQSRGKFKRKGMVGSLNTFTARSMIVTGIVLLCFIIFHILDLTAGVTPAAPDTFAHGAAYANVVASFSRPGVAIFYVIAMVVLFLHLSHGLWTAVSDLGITGKRWRAILLFVAYLVPALVMIGNSTIPLGVMFGLIG